jgi:hypothetical protein
MERNMMGRTASRIKHAYVVAVASTLPLAGEGLALGKAPFIKKPDFLWVLCRSLER